MEYAGPGEVIVSEVVPPAVARSPIGFQERGEHELKGYLEPGAFSSLLTRIKQAQIRIRMAYVKTSWIDFTSPWSDFHTLSRDSSMRGFSPLPRRGARFRAHP